MSKYICEACNYKTDLKWNYTKHLATKKHDIKKTTSNSLPTVSQLPPIIQKSMEKNVSNDSKIKVLKSGVKYNKVTNKDKKEMTDKVTTDANNKDGIRCIYCKTVFARLCNLTKHQTKCGEKNKKVNELQNKINILETMVKNKRNKIKKMKHKFQEQLKEKDQLIEYFKTLAKMEGNKYTTMNSINYVKINFNNAPPLKKIKNVNAFKKKQNDNDFIELIIYYHSRNSLAPYIGDTLVSIYKKENERVNEQRFWNTDCSRLTYIIRDVLNNKISEEQLNDEI